jgi:hypothetical protein
MDVQANRPIVLKCRSSQIQQPMAINKCSLMVSSSPCIVVEWMKQHREHTSTSIRQQTSLKCIISGVLHHKHTLFTQMFAVYYYPSRVHIMVHVMTRVSARQMMSNLVARCSIGLELICIIWKLTVRHTHTTVNECILCSTWCHVFETIVRFTSALCLCWRLLFCRAMSTSKLQSIAFKSHK